MAGPHAASALLTGGVWRVNCSSSQGGAGNCARMVAEKLMLYAIGLKALGIHSLVGVRERGAGTSVNDLGMKEGMNDRTTE